MEYISLINEGYRKERGTQYKYLGQGYAWHNKKALQNDLFFNDRKIVSVSSSLGSNRTRLLKVTDNKKIATNSYKLINIDDYNVITDYNEVIQLENGSYLIQKIDNNGNKRSLFMGKHEKNGLILPYFYALNLLTKLNFEKIARNNINLNSNIISIFEIIGNKNVYNINNKLMLKKTIIEINEYNLSIDNKKEFIRKYNSKFEDKIIMFNNGNFFIFNRQDPENKLN